eukprot:6090446-Pyramimonas_sp.AAC.1
MQLSHTEDIRAGGLERFLFQAPSVPCSGGLPPPPLPCVWTGSPARCQRALFGPRWLRSKRASVSARWPPRWPKIAVHGSR